MKIFLLSFFLLLSGCSLQTPPNAFEYKSANAFSSYTQNFLSANDLLAHNDMIRAIKHAKQTANLNTLGRIYLGECSLNISVGIKDDCDKYRTIKDIVDDKNLNAYYNFIRQKLQKKEIDSLPKKYKSYAVHIIQKQYNQAYQAILNIDDINSQLIAAYLMKEHFNEKQINTIIEKASFYGYKKSVLFWLATLRDVTIDTHAKENIRKKIEILQSDK